MIESVKRVTDAVSFQEAIAQGSLQIEIDGLITDLPSLKLPAGTVLRGAGQGAGLRFKGGQPGLMLSADHVISGLRLVTDATQVALGLADDVDDLGTITINAITASGRIHLEGNRAKRGALELSDIHVDEADARMVAHRPAGYGVEVLLGCISICNFSRDTSSRWTLEARNLSGGRKDQPLRGSGIAVFGGWSIPFEADMSNAPAPTKQGGSIELRILTTGEIHVDGGIPKGIGNLIAGGVFVGSGVHAHRVVNEGTTTTYGQNDMVLDNWGTVDAWITKGNVTSFGPSGIGFVNFGDIDTLKTEAPIETHGLGARGFNLYDGTIRLAEIQSITTYGDGAIGIQLSRPFGTIIVDNDVRTKGGQGSSLVRGKIMQLKAHAISIKPGTKGDRISIGGAAIAEDEAITAWDFETPATVVTRIEAGGHTVS